MASSGTKQRIEEAMQELASDAWFRREESPDGLERVTEIRKLVDEQIKEDTNSTVNRRDRVGREWVVTDDGRITDDMHVIWTARSPDQIALQEGMEPFLSSLTPEERMLLMMAYSEGLTERQIADATNKSQPTAHREIKRATAKLAELIKTAFLPEEESA